jgi:hypothetical protein
LLELHEPANSAAGRAALERMAADTATPRTFRDRAEEAVADWDFLSGAYEGASERYRALAARTVDEDQARTLEVKAMAAHEPAAREPMALFLLGTKERSPEPLLSGAKIGAWSERSHDALADYILGKNLAQRGWHREALGYLERALAAGPPTVRVHRELLRAMAQCACALGDGPRIERVRADIEGAASPFPKRGSGRLESVEMLLNRCAVR